MAHQTPEPMHLPPSAHQAPPTPSSKNHLPGGADAPMRGHGAADPYPPGTLFRPRIPARRLGLWTPAVLFAAGMALGTAAVWHWVTPAAPSRASQQLGAPGGPSPRAATLQTPEAAQVPPASPPQAASLLFTADGPIGAPEIFWLDNPSRLVVDLMGVKPAAAAPVVAAHHPGVRRIRLGAHSDRTRYVIEMAQTRRPEVLTRVEGRALAVTLRFVETDCVQTD